jgi:uncharacterized protein
MNRVQQVAKWFGVEESKDEGGRMRDEINPSDSSFIPHPSSFIHPGRVVLISGASGSGKSSLMRAMREKCAHGWIDLQKIRLRDVPVVDCFGEEPVEKVLERLSRVGLGEVWTYLRRSSQLSEGQRWRLRLAIGIHRANQSRAPVVLAADEFAALLDRVTAKVVARCVRKAVDAMPHLCVIVATSHDDLTHALAPDILIRCDYGAITVDTNPPPENSNTPRAEPDRVGPM